MSGPALSHRRSAGRGVLGALLLGALLLGALLLGALLLGALLLSGCSALRAPGARVGAIPEGFTPLFNGRDLTGWHPSRTTHQGTTPKVTVEDGAIVLAQHPYGQGGVLLTDERYDDFELYLEVRPDWGTNGGLLFRATESGSGYQVEIEGGGTGGTGSLFGEMLRVERGARVTELGGIWREDDWNALRLRVVGDVPRMTLWLNGVQLWEVQAARNDLIAGAVEGYIGLQAHWSATETPVPDDFPMHASWRPGAVHRYRNVAIKRLERRAP